MTSVLLRGPIIRVIVVTTCVVPEDAAAIQFRPLDVK